jgi:hypothetical protein
MQKTDFSNEKSWHLNRGILQIIKVNRFVNPSLLTFVLKPKYVNDGFTKSKLKEDKYLKTSLVFSLGFKANEEIMNIKDINEHKMSEYNKYALILLIV